MAVTLAKAVTLAAATATTLARTRAKALTMASTGTSAEARTRAPLAGRPLATLARGATPVKMLPIRCKAA